MSLRSEAEELADHVVTSALHELRLGIREAVKDYRERACWRATFHTVMVRELVHEQVEAERHGRKAKAFGIGIRIGWHDSRRLRAVAECEANDIERQLMARCMSALATTP